MSVDSSTDPMAPAVDVPSGLPPQTVSSALHDYVDKLRGGDLGSLPAALGLLVLAAIFSGMKPDEFFNVGNFANIFVQAAPTIVIAMGLIFVLLLGEIDLAAGFTAGTSAAVLAVTLTLHEWPWYLSVLLCLFVGLAIGFFMGTLVARLQIPSFVVTLAMFLALQGVLLIIIGDNGTIAVRDPQILFLMNNNLSVAMSWALAVVVVAGYAGITFRQLQGRRKAGLHAASTSVWAARVIGLAVVVAGGTYLLCLERGPRPDLKSIKGVPGVVPLILILLIGLTFMTNRTALGRHIYAVGGNAEAARRAGINVGGIRVFCFIVGSMMAAVGGILLASRQNGVDPGTGGSLTLLLAVAAAVIGGTSLFGGKGNVKDAVIGGLVVAVINNGLPFITSNAGATYIVTGGVLLIAASVDALSRRRAQSSGRA